MQWNKPKLTIEKQLASLFKPTLIIGITFFSFTLQLFPVKLDPWKSNFDMCLSHSVNWKIVFQGGIILSEQFFNACMLKNVFK